MAAALSAIEHHYSEALQFNTENPRACLSFDFDKKGSTQKNAFGEREEGIQKSSESNHEKRTTRREGQPLLWRLSERQWQSIADRGKIRDHLFRRLTIY